jgi:hypothetical protein
MRAKAAALNNGRRAWRRLTAGWSIAQEVDYNPCARRDGLDFDLRVLRPWQRDPAFYVSRSGPSKATPPHMKARSITRRSSFGISFPLDTPRLNRS